jgi:hypothetical protein
MWAEAAEGVGPELVPVPVEAVVEAAVQVAEGCTLAAAARWGLPDASAAVVESVASAWSPGEAER